MGKKRKTRGRVEVLRDKLAFFEKTRKQKCPSKHGKLSPINQSNV
jgi:hypothetical protein